MIDAYDKQQHKHCDNHNKNYFHNSFPLSHSVPHIKTKVYQTIKFTTPYTKWQIVKIEIGIKAILFFLSIAKNKNVKQGGTVNPNITTAFVIPL